MQERVQKILAHAGIASRRQAEQMILAGRVTVDGRVCALGDTADATESRICVDGTPIPAERPPVYIMLNKPRGYVTTAADEQGRRTVLDLVDCGQRVFPVGRLDLDSEGLLLLTSDGELTNRLLHPSGRVDKTYLVWVIRAGAEPIRRMGEPMELDGSKLAPARVETLWLRGDQAELRVTIHQGKNRQIRRMAEACGMHVTRLRRIREGPVSLGELKPGTWRYLTEAEIRALEKL